MNINALLLTDGYKTGHHKMYPIGTNLVYSNFTPRANKYAPNKATHVVVFGIQMAIQQIHEAFEDYFFSQPKEKVISEIKNELSLYLNTDYDVKHFEELHELGYLPIEIKAIEEGELVPIRIPILTIKNTLPQFYWITNYLETVISNLLWKPLTSATISYEYRKILKQWQEKTDIENAWVLDWQAHDFSMRGMDSIEAVISSGLGHLTSFKGSDSLPTIYGARKFYDEDGFVCGSVNATEHSVACSHMEISNNETVEYLVEVTYDENGNFIKEEKIN
jgi:nicotinamide phosphoribosyltransferase